VNDLPDLTRTNRGSLQEAVADRVKAAKEIKAREALMRSRLRKSLNKRGTKIRRNAKCPCGSGKKHKSCCMRDLESKTNDTKKEASDRTP